MQKLNALDKKIILLFPEMRVTENIFIRVTAKKKTKKQNPKKTKIKKIIDLIEFLKKSLQLKSTLTALLFVEKQRA